MSRLELGWKGIRRVARVGAGVIRRFLEGHAQEIVGMAIHIEICGRGSTERVPAHWCVRFGGCFLCARTEGGERAKRGTVWTRWRAWPVRGEGEGGGGRVGVWESGKLNATGRRLFVSCG